MTGRGARPSSAEPATPSEPPGGDPLRGLKALTPPVWPAAVHDEEDLELAVRYAPILLLDEREPFEPEVVGYRVFRESRPSPSFPREIHIGSFQGQQAAGPDGEERDGEVPGGKVTGSQAPGDVGAVDVAAGSVAPGGEAGQQSHGPAVLAVEYAIWWDWDIEHLYELEHVWVYVDAGGRPVRVEASWHGGWNDLRLGQEGGAVLEGTHPLVYVKPGKHALAADPSAFEPVREAVTVACGRLAGTGGVWVTPLFAGRLAGKTPLADRLVHTYLQGHRFEPSFSFTRRFVIGPERLVPWETLEEAIPQRVAWWVEELEAHVPAEERRWLRIGHRGAAGHAPENSATALRLAAQLGADMVELDVRLTRDGVPVVIHDADLDRVTTGQGPVAQRAWEELKDLRLRDSVTGEARDEGLMTLAEALALCRSERLGAYLDIKDSAAIPAVVDAVREHFYPQAVIVGASDPADVRTVRQLAPELAVAWLVGLPVRDVGGLLAELVAMDGTYLHLCWEHAGDRPDEALTRDDVEQVHRAGKGLVCWHEERASVIEGLRRLGVDGVCSDRPEMLV